jgi:transcriptional regulator with XRE-family HTH domain
MSAGERLQEERKRLGLNQTDFGSIGGVSRRTQMNYEANGSSPDIRYWESISRIGADVQYILTGLHSVNAERIRTHTGNSHGNTTTQVIDTQLREKMVWDELFGLLNPEDRARLMEIAVTLAEAHAVKNHPDNIR